MKVSKGKGKYDLYSKDGKKRLGKDLSAEGVKKRERQVNYFKHLSNRFNK